MGINWTVRVVVKGVARADLEQWLAHHCAGRYETKESDIYSRGAGIGTTAVELELMSDRIRLREAFDVVKMEFVSTSRW